MSNFINHSWVNNPQSSKTMKSNLTMYTSNYKSILSKSTSIYNSNLSGKNKSTNFNCKMNKDKLYKKNHTLKSSQIIKNHNFKTNKLNYSSRIVTKEEFENICQKNKNTKILGNTKLLKNFFSNVVNKNSDSLLEYFDSENNSEIKQSVFTNFDEKTNAVEIIHNNNIYEKKQNLNFKTNNINKTIEKNNLKKNIINYEEFEKIKKQNPNIKLKKTNNSKIIKNINLEIKKTTNQIKKKDKKIIRTNNEFKNKTNSFQNVIFDKINLQKLKKNSVDLKNEILVKNLEEIEFNKNESTRTIADFDDEEILREYENFLDLIEEKERNIFQKQMKNMSEKDIIKYIRYILENQVDENEEQIEDKKDISLKELEDDLKKEIGSGKIGLEKKQKIKPENVIFIQSNRISNKIDKNHQNEEKTKEILNVDQGLKSFINLDKNKKSKYKIKDIDLKKKNDKEIDYLVEEDKINIENEEILNEKLQEAFNIIKNDEKEIERIIDQNFQRVEKNETDRNLNENNRQEIKDLNLKKNKKDVKEKGYLEMIKEMIYFQNEESSKEINQEKKDEEKTNEKKKDENMINEEKKDEENTKEEEKDDEEKKDEKNLKNHKEEFVSEIKVNERKNSSIYSMFKSLLF